MMGSFVKELNPTFGSPKVGKSSRAAEKLERYRLPARGSSRAPHPPVGGFVEHAFDRLLAGYT